MRLFSVAVREHAYTGRFYSDVVQAESYEEALQVAAEHAAAPWPPPGSTPPGLTPPGPTPPGSMPQQGFDDAVTGRTHTGRPDTGAGHVGPREEAEQHAGLREEAEQSAAEPVAAPQPAPGPPPQRAFSVAVREQADTGQVYTEVVQAGSPEEALLAAAEQAAAPRPSPEPGPQADAAGRPMCADVWIYSLLHCELVAGHDPPHMAVARGYGRPVRWVRDDRGVARTLPDPVTGVPPVGPITQPTPAPAGESRVAVPLQTRD